MNHMLREERVLLLVTKCLLHLITSREVGLSMKPRRCKKRNSVLLLAHFAMQFMTEICHKIGSLHITKHRDLFALCLRLLGCPQLPHATSLEEGSVMTF